MSEVYRHELDSLRDDLRRDLEHEVASLRNELEQLRGEVERIHQALSTVRRLVREETALLWEALGNLEGGSK